MKNFLLSFLVFLIYSLFGMWYYSCVIKKLCNSDGLQNDTESVINVESENDESNESKNILIHNKKGVYSSTYKEGDIMFDFPDNLAIKPNQANVILPFGNKDFKESIFNFLNANQSKELLLIGLYNSDESSLDPELGLKRASYVKDILVEFGINSDRISIQGKKANYKYDNTDKLFVGGIQFDFLEISEEKRKAIETGIENKTLYSGFGSKQFRADNTLQAYALELKNYLEKYSDKTARIVGHTDSVGDELANDWYGMERAKNVKQYLISQGVAETRLFTSSKGELEPIESNATLEGRRKNRRIEIKIN
ncbi:MAG: OmpA family protein [Bacteroidia bacterium]|nr:OmpA family protein [Bacteroidia bacterium]